MCAPKHSIAGLLIVPFKTCPFCYEIYNYKNCYEICYEEK